jgi:protein PhnA
MAKGRDKQDAYEAALQRLGRDLARRAKSKCELTGASGTLRTVDLEGPKVEPDLDHVVLVSPLVSDHLKGRGLQNRNELHYLESAVWSDLSPVRRAAIAILSQIDEPWAEEAIENANMMEANEADE